MEQKHIYWLSIKTSILEDFTEYMLEELLTDIVSASYRDTISQFEFMVKEANA